MVDNKKNSDLIFQLIEKFGKENMELSKKNHLPENTKYMYLYDLPYNGCSEERVQAIATISDKSKEANMFYLSSYSPWNDIPFKPLNLEYIDGKGSEFYYNSYSAGKDILFSIAQALINENYISEDKNIHNLIKQIVEEKCPEVLEIKRGSINPKENLSGEFNYVFTEIGKVLEQKYHGKLNFPAPISLLKERAHALWLDAVSIEGDSSNWHFVSSVGTDGVSDDRYKLDFLKTLKDLLGGEKYDSWGGNGKPEGVHRNVDITKENITSQEALDQLIEAHNGVLPLHGELLYNISGYNCKRIYPRGKGVYVVDYAIYPSPETFSEAIDVKNIEKIIGKNLVQYAKEYHDDYKKDEAKRFQNALKKLMPNVYADIVLKNELDVQSLDEVLTYYNTKEKVSNKLQELKNKTKSEKIEDIPHAKTQILREVAKDNLGKPKRSDADKKVIKAAMDKAISKTRK